MFHRCLPYLHKGIPPEEHTPESGVSRGGLPGHPLWAYPCHTALMEEGALYPRTYRALLVLGWGCQPSWVLARTLLVSALPPMLGPHSEMPPCRANP